VGYEIVVVGTSWGGLNAVRELIVGLPRDFALPIVVVQHRHRQSDNLLASLLQDSTSLCVTEVEDKSPIAPATVHVAPPDYHLLVEEGFFSLSTDEPVRYSRPSIDVTFVSAADTYGDRTAGVVLTGANEDGSLGLRRIVDRGGAAYVQVPATAESPAMPRGAMEMVPEAHVLTLQQIATELAALPTGTGGGATR
jgi:two-component system chemotaxis response regulator CheB